MKENQNNLSIVNTEPSLGDNQISSSTQTSSESHSQTSTQIPTSPNPPTTKKSFRLLLLGGVILIIFTVISSIFFLQNQKSEVVQTPTDNQEALSPTPDPKANWKTYINEEYGISFQYPPQWFATEYPSASPFSIALTPSPYSTEIILDAPRQDGVYVHYSWTHDRNANPTRQYDSIIDAVDHHVSFINPRSLNLNYFKILDKEAVTLQGTTKTDNMWTNNQPIHTTYVQLDDEVLIISLSGEYQDIYKQILSTFKILE